MSSYEVLIALIPPTALVMMFTFIWETRKPGKPGGNQGQSPYCLRSTSGTIRDFREFGSTRPPPAASFP